MAYTSKYYFTISNPDKYKKAELEDYGITHLVVFHNYIEMYNSMYDAFLASKKLPKEKIDEYKNISTTNLKLLQSKTNDAYFFQFKSPFDFRERKFTLPAFFINRTLTMRIEASLQNYSIFFIYGPRVSGKTFLLASIVNRIKNKDVYFFDSRTSINKEALDSILLKTNSVIIFDSNSISKDMIHTILNRKNSILSLGIKIIIAINSSDRDIVSEIQTPDTPMDKDIISYLLPPKLNYSENSQINELLSSIALPKFSSYKTIIDNLIEASSRLSIRNQYTNIVPYMRNVDDLVILIMLAINEKIYTEDLVTFDILSSGIEQVMKCQPLINNDYTLLLERSINHASNHKIVINAKYWLLKNLGTFVENKANQKIVVNAYTKIIGTILRSNRKHAYSEAIDYYRFDVINDIFRNDRKGQSGLIKSIYAELQPLLSKYPNYYHQRAKCYLWQSKYNMSDITDLKEALRFTEIAIHNFEIDYEEKKNFKLSISIAHALFTKTLIMSRISAIVKHASPEWDMAVDAIFNAWQKDINLNAFSENFDSRINKKKVDDIIDVIQHFPDNSKISHETKAQLSEIRTTLMRIH